MHEAHSRDCESRADSHDATILIFIPDDNSVEGSERPCIQMQAPAIRASRRRVRERSTYRINSSSAPRPESYLLAAMC